MHPLDLELPIHLRNLHVPRVSVVPGESPWPALARLRAEELKFLQSCWTGVFPVILICDVVDFPHTCLCRDRCPLIHAVQLCLPGAAQSRPLPVADSTLHAACRSPSRAGSRVDSETPTGLPFAQTAWDSLVLVSVSQHTLKRDVVRPLLLWQLFMKKLWKVKALVA